MKKIVICLLVAVALSFQMKAQVWEPVGDPTGISAANAGRLALKVDYQDNVVVGYYDVSVAKGSVQKFNGNIWSYLGGGPGMTSATAAYNSLSLDAQGVVYFTNQAGWPAAGLNVHKFINNAWENLPDATSVTINFQASAVSANGTLFVATGESSGIVRRYVNGAWEQVGNSGFCGGGPSYLSMTIANDDRIYVSWNNNGFVHVYTNLVNATTTDLWQPVGNVPNIAPATTSENYNSTVAVDLNNNLFLAYVSDNTGGRKLNVKKFDGETWSQLGPENFTANRVQHISIAIGDNDIIYVAASNWEDENFLRNYVMAYDEATNTWYQAGTGWASVNQATNNSLAVDSNGNLFLGFVDSGLGKLSVKKLNLEIVAAESLLITPLGGGNPEINTDGGSLQLLATVYPEQASQLVVWSVVSGQSHATIDQNGLLTATASNAVVTVKAQSAENSSIFNTIDVTITNQISPVLPQEVSVATEDGGYPDILGLDNTLQLIATVTPPEADQYVTWSIEEGSDVVSIDQNGLITSLSEGYAIVRATVDANVNLYADYRVNVFENGCTQGTETMNLDYGLTISHPAFAAADFVVDDEVRFAISTVRMRLMVEKGATVTSFDLHFMKDDNGQPGDEITVVSNIIPIVTYVGEANSLWDYFDVEMYLAKAVTFDQGNYWLSSRAYTNITSNVYWTATLSPGNGLHAAFINTADGHGWRSQGGFYMVYDITGNCTAMPVVINTAGGVDTEIVVGEILQLEATVNAPGLSQNVNWSVESGSGFASVNANGLVTGTGVGVATVRATSVDNVSVYYEIEVTVLDPNACYQEVLSNNLEDGYTFGSGVHLAVDIIVEEGQTFTISSADVNVANFATEFSFIFYSDVAGLPGSHILTTEEGTITHNIVTGHAYDLIWHRYAVELENPVTLPTGTYWMEMVSNASAWEATSADLLGHPGAFKSESTGGKWVYSSSGKEFVYKLNGVCTSIIEQPWTFTVTGQAHTINVPVTANPNIFGEPLEAGDWVGVFFVDENGNEVCAGAQQINPFGSAVVTAYGNDATTPEKDGFAAGERFNWKIFDMSEQIEYSAGATYDASMPNQGNFADFGLSKLTSLQVMYCQYYSFTTGWNSVSSYIEPFTPAVEDLFAPMVNNLTILRNLTQLYWPSEDVNTIGNFDNQSGYALKSTANVSFEICGATFASSEIVLEAGWHYLPVLSECPVNAMDLFGAHLADIVIVTDLIGSQVFWPAMGVYSLEYLQPGKAYKIKLANPITLTFPVCDGKATYPAFDQVNNLNTPWGNLEISPNAQTVAFTTNAQTEMLKGDMIGAFDQNNKLCGFIEITGNSAPQAMMLIGDDATTTEKDGFAEGENISFRLFRASTGEEFALEVIYDINFDNATGNYLSSSLSAINAVTMGVTGINNPGTSGISIYPNPATDFVVINIATENFAGATITVNDTKGRTVIERMISSSDSKLDISNLESGVYIISIKSDSLNQISKLIVR